MGDFMAKIYEIVNDINGKIYIGQTTRTLKERFRIHCRDRNKEAFKNRPLYRAMNKYGIEHFHISLLEETDIPNERETYWIEQKGSYQNGYNATRGGEGRCLIDHKEVKQLYDIYKNVRKVAQLLGIHRETCSDILHGMGVNIRSSGEIARERWNTAVVQIDPKTGEVIKTFSSIKEAEQAIGLHGHGHIGDVCLGKRKTCGGFNWKYLKDL